MKADASLTVRILSISETLRNPNLIDSLHGVFHRHKLHVEIIRGIDGRKVDCSNDPLIDPEGNRLVLGRDLTSGEAACVMGHHKIQTTEVVDWLLVLEDDAQLCVLDGIEEMLILLKSRWDFNPVICNVFEGMYGISNMRSRLKKSSSIATLIKPSSGAVAYFINEKAQRLAISQKQVVGVADWPLWIYRVIFLQSTVGFFNTHPNTESLISPQMVKEYSVTTPKYKRGILNSLLGYFDNELRKAFGGSRLYFRAVIAEYFYRSIERLFPN